MSIVNTNMEQKYTEKRPVILVEMTGRFYQNVKAFI